LKGGGVGNALIEKSIDGRASKAEGRAVKERIAAPISDTKGSGVGKEGSDSKGGIRVICICIKSSRNEGDGSSGSEGIGRRLDLLPKSMPPYGSSVKKDFKGAGTSEGSAGIEGSAVGKVNGIDGRLIPPKPKALACDTTLRSNMRHISTKCYKQNFRL
jgi:hypothetical protein